MDDLLQILPSFFILGANKAGTTTLYAALGAHPDVFFPYKKETHFFNNDLFYERGIDWYVSNFFASGKGFPARGDATPAYLHWGEKVIPRLQKAYPGRAPQMVVILRDPVARAYSRYWHNRKFERETLSFEAALEAESERFSRNQDYLTARGKTTWAYFESGLYGKQLKLYFDNFARENFHILLLDDLKMDFQHALKGVLRFLGLEENAGIPEISRNTAARPRRGLRGLHMWIRSRRGIGSALKSALPLRAQYVLRKTMRGLFLENFTYPPMEPQTESKLRLRFLDDIQLLEKLLDRDFSRWYPASAKARP